IYSVAGKMTPMGDFRPASPDSFEDDYDDVSLSESDRGRKAAEDELQSQRSKGGTGVYILAGKPASPNTSQKASPLGWFGENTSVAVLYVLVALSFVAWVVLFTLAMMKQMEIMAELKLLRSNYTENEASGRSSCAQRRREVQRRVGDADFVGFWLFSASVFFPSVVDNKKCSAGWKTFERSCYSFSTERMSWWDAKEVCANQGAHLVIVNSEQEQ
ncbi:C-type lectin domain family 17, member A, partial [Chlamydotis macqueenii]